MNYMFDTLLRQIFEIQIQKSGFSAGLIDDEAECSSVFSSRSEKKLMRQTLWRTG
jgi:hypothetical protein